MAWKSGEQDAVDYFRETCHMALQVLVATEKKTVSEKVSAT